MRGYYSSALRSLGVILLTLVAMPVYADFVNGNFEQGNAGFQSQYVFLTPPASSNPDEYGVGTNPAAYNGSWATFGDHTTGHGQMLVVDGSTNPSLYVWQETVTGLSIGTEYVISGWSASVDDTVETPPATLMIAVGGAQIGSLVDVPAAPAVWQEFNENWTATSTTATFQIFDTQTSHLYNDFALDDLSLQPASVPEPPSALLTALGLLTVAIYSIHLRMPTSRPA